MRVKEVARPDVVRVIERNNSGRVTSKQLAAGKDAPLRVGESPRIVDAAQKCPMCQKMFSNPGAFKQHMAVAHSEALIAMGQQVTSESLVGMTAEKIRSMGSWR